ncbi:COPII coat assembly protein sec16 [Elsinoe australis]|uniref:COPII coat assembly protein sec16 n=1 Tax=Elsinoe australis TaxID=40998 RepID=A0A2P7ZD10_9PEZI|nr:COPII coat assembly protein sec16 [Elsinoe australis]
MRRLLLSSGQVSLLLSCIITLAFTALLFLTGLFLQRRTVSSLRLHLAPNLPPIPASHYKAPAPADLPRYANPDYPLHLAAQSYAAQQQSVDWARLAHVQIPTSHRAVCSSVMLFAELHRLKSPARRVMVFPQEWIEGAADWAGGKGGGKRAVEDPWGSTTRRLLRVAGRRYGVQLRPVGIEAGEGEGKKGWWGSGEKEVRDEGVELERHRLSAVLGLGDLERVLVVRTPGWVLDASGLDAALAYGGVERVAALKGVNGTDAVLVRTDKGLGDKLRVRLGSEKKEVEVREEDKYGLPAVGVKEMDTFAALGISVDEMMDSEEVSLMASIGALHDAKAEEPFNATKYLSSSSYITFTDHKLPAGPEYDVPFSDKVRARPVNKDADWVWTSLYGKFAERRREVCGLDLEWYPQS